MIWVRPFALATDSTYGSKSLSWCISDMNSNGSRPRWVAAEATRSGNASGEVEAVAGEPVGEVSFIGWLRSGGVDVGRRRWRTECDLGAHHVVIHRTHGGRRLILLPRRAGVTARVQDLSAPVQRLSAHRRLRIPTEHRIPRGQRAIRIAEHEMVQAAAEGAGHTGVARRIGGHQTVVDPRCAGVVAELLLGLASF